MIADPADSCPPPRAKAAPRRYRPRGRSRGRSPGPCAACGQPLESGSRADRRYHDACKARLDRASKRAKKKSSLQELDELEARLKTTFEETLAGIERVRRALGREGTPRVKEKEDGKEKEASQEDAGGSPHESS